MSPSKIMKHPLFLLAIFLLSPLLRAADGVETIVCIRHGEKTPTEMGQLSVRGLNRSLALPEILLSKFGRPAFIFAPDPAKEVRPPGGQPSCYIRPLATIEPTAIRCQLPVNTRFGFEDIARLEAELRKPVYEGAVVFVSWEHVWLVKFVRHLVAGLGGDPAQVPDWPSSDFDSIYVVRIAAHDGRNSVSFALDHEGIGRPSDRFPLPAASAD
jgi:hypothetical protein